MTTVEKKELKEKAALVALNGLMTSNGKIIVGLDLGGANIDEELERLVTIATSTADFFVKQIEFEEDGD
jgi:hypothetical protein